MDTPAGTVSGLTLQVVGELWDALSAEEQLERLQQLGIACFNNQSDWDHRSPNQKSKIFNAWRRWIATCE